MNKFKIIAASLLIASMSSFSSMAAGISEGFRIGLGISDTEVNGSGTERLRDGSGTVTTIKGGSDTATTSANTTIGHIFAEKTFASGLTFGVDYIPGEADVATKSRADDDIESANGNKASAVVSDHVTVYGLMPLGSTPFFVKGGVISMDVETNEKLNTGSKYGNTSVNGVIVGIGAHLERDNGLFARVEANMAEYESLTLKSDGGNTIDADLDTTAIKFSIGKSF